MDQLIIPTFIIASLALLVAIVNTLAMFYSFFFSKRKICEQHHQRKNEHIENVYVTVGKFKEFQNEIKGYIDEKLLQPQVTKESEAAEQNIEVNENEKTTGTHGFFGYPKGDANNCFFTEFLSKNDNAKFEAIKIDKVKAKFKPLNIRDLKEIDGMLKAIEVGNEIALDKAKNFEIIEDGIAINDNNCWIIDKKAKIKFL